MTIQPSLLKLNRLRVMRRGYAAYDHKFHDGVNIIRGQNGSGKSTIADFIFYILGGEFDEWKGAAGLCDEVQAEISTARGALTLKRQIDSAQTQILVYFGGMEEASQRALEGWERYPVRRQGGRESFSQVLFRSCMIPEAKSEGAANITMHQLLRLCYSDQRTPSTRLFRFENFDTQNIREAVGDLICGISGFEIYEIGLELRDRKKERDTVEARLAALHRALPADRSLDTPKLIAAATDELRQEQERLKAEIENADQMVDPSDVKSFLRERRKAQGSLIKQREKLKSLENTEGNLDFELREIRDFVDYLDSLTEKLGYAEATLATLGSIEFTHCPACGEELEVPEDAAQCIVCKSPVDPDTERSRFNRIRLDLEIQTRESNQLVRQKEAELKETKLALRSLRREHEKCLADFGRKYARDNGPREAFLAERTTRIGAIEAEIDFLLRGLSVAEEIAQLAERKAEIQTQINQLEERLKVLNHSAQRRRSFALTRVSDFAAEILRSDLPRQEEFQTAERVNINFFNDRISVDSVMNFSASSNVILKNAAIFSLFLAAGNDPNFFHPRFLLLDNIEDKGMEEARSHNFQRIIVERATEMKLPYQIIFTTSMMNPDLEMDDYVIGPSYTKDMKTLDIDGVRGNELN